MKLLSLLEWNDIAGRQYAYGRDMTDLPNGIACPDCGAQTLDCNRNELLTSAPPRLRIRCPKCPFKGYRIA